MNRNLFAFFIASIMFVQVFPITNWTEMAKSGSFIYGEQQMEEDEAKVEKSLTDQLDWENLQLNAHNNLLLRYINVDSSAYCKGYASIHLPPPNFLAFS